MMPGIGILRRKDAGPRHEEYWPRNGTTPVFHDGRRAATIAFEIAPRSDLMDRANATLERSQRPRCPPHVLGLRGNRPRSCQGRRRSRDGIDTTSRGCPYRQATQGGDRRSGSFGQNQGGIQIEDVNLTEQVNQVRKYRNWVAHGKPRRARELGGNPTSQSSGSGAISARLERRSREPRRRSPRPAESPLASEPEGLWMSDRLRLPLWSSPIVVTSAPGEDDRRPLAGSGTAVRAG